MDETLNGLFKAVEAGDAAAADALFAALYDELHRMAGRQLAREGSDLTLGTTTLLHEAYLDMSGRASAVFPDEGRFLGYAARVMRTLIIDHVRQRKAQKRGGRFEITSLTGDIADPAGESRRLARIGEAVDALAGIDPLLAQIVDLKFFCGFSFAEIAAVRGLSSRTVQRHWEKARLFLHEALDDAGAD